MRSEFHDFWRQFERLASDTVYWRRKAAAEEVARLLNEYRGQESALKATADANPQWAAALKAAFKLRDAKKRQQRKWLGRLATALADRRATALHETNFEMVINLADAPCSLCGADKPAVIGKFTVANAKQLMVCDACIEAAHNGGGLSLDDALIDRIERLEREARSLEEEAQKLKRRQHRAESNKDYLAGLIGRVTLPQATSAYLDAVKRLQDGTRKIPSGPRVAA